jgi:hypothetical protein
MATPFTPARHSRPLGDTTNTPSAKPPLPITRATPIVHAGTPSYAPRSARTPPVPSAQKAFHCEWDEDADSAFAPPAGRVATQRPLVRPTGTREDILGNLPRRSPAATDPGTSRAPPSASATLHTTVPTVGDDDEDETLPDIEHMHRGTAADRNPTYRDLKGFIEELRGAEVEETAPLFLDVPLLPDMMSDADSALLFGPQEEPTLLPTR